MASLPWLCPRPLTSAKALLSDYAANNSGNFAIMFAVLAVPLISAVGIAVDLSRAYRVTSITQNALDSAVLAAGRAGQTNTTNTLSAATSAATSFYNAAKPVDVLSSTISLAADSTNTNFTLTATSWVSTPFLGILSRMFTSAAPSGAPAGCNSNYSCLKISRSATASIGAGGNGGSNVELSLMLDVTGSMGDPIGSADGSIKIDALKTAAKELIDIILPTGKANPHARIALVPFSTYVNLGDYVAGATGQTLEKKTDSNYNCNPHQVCIPAVKTCTEYYTSGKNKGTCKTWQNPSCNTVYDTCTKTTTTYLKRCLTERTGNDAVKDTAPSTGFAYSYVSSLSSAQNCGPGAAAKLLPLTTDGQALKDVIDDFYQAMRPRRRSVAMQMEEKGLMPLAMAIQHRQLGEQTLQDVANQYVAADKGMALDLELRSAKPPASSRVASSRNAPPTGMSLDPVLGRVVGASSWLWAAVGWAVAAAVGAGSSCAAAVGCAPGALFTPNVKLPLLLPLSSGVTAYHVTVYTPSPVPLVSVPLRVL